MTDLFRNEASRWLYEWIINHLIIESFIQTIGLKTIVLLRLSLELLSLAKQKMSNILHLNLLFVERFYKINNHICSRANI